MIRFCQRFIFQLQRVAFIIPYSDNIQETNSPSNVSLIWRRVKSFDSTDISWYYIHFLNARGTVTNRTHAQVVLEHEIHRRDKQEALWYVRHIIRTGLKHLTVFKD